MIHHRLSGAVQLTGNRPGIDALITASTGYFNSGVDDHLHSDLCFWRHARNLSKYNHCYITNIIISRLRRFVNSKSFEIGTDAGSAAAAFAGGPGPGDPGRQQRRFSGKDKDARQEELSAERLCTCKTGLRMSESVRFHQSYRIEMGFRKEVHSELRSSFSRRDMTLFSMRKIDFLRSYS
jgi:hypothetical protein